jgi:hypothetical protein
MFKKFLLTTTLLLGTTSAYSQGCSMCSTTAASAPERSQRALRRGIIVLMVPSLAVMLGFVGLAYRYRD